MGTDYLKDLGCSLIEQGYSIVPIKPGEKYPKGLNHWQEIEATEEDVICWSGNGFKGGGVGVLCGYIVGIDLDILDSAISRKMVAWCIKNLGSAPQRIGNAPKTLFVFRTKKPFTKISSPVYLNDELLGDEQKVEILGKGQQFVAYAVHPDTGKPYRWVNGPGISDINFNDLPEITMEQATECVAYFESIVPADWAIKSKRVQGRQLANCENPDGLDFMRYHSPKADVTTAEIEIILAELKDFADLQGFYDEWTYVGMGLHHEFDGSEKGYEYWRDWSEGGHDYNENELRVKWKSFKNKTNSYQRTFGWAKEQARFKKKERLERERRKETLSKLPSNNDLDQSDDNATEKDLDDLELFLKRYVLAEEGRLVCDLTKQPHRSLSKLEDFREATMQVRKEISTPTKADPEKTKQVAVCDLWRANPEKRVVQAAGYLPGGERIFRNNEDGLEYINTFCMPDFSKYIELLGNLDVFFEHIDYLVPDKSERGWFIDWMAFCLQRPEERCKVTPLHVSVPHGTGRGWVVELLDKLHGSWNCTKTKFSTLCGEGSGGGFHDYFNRSLLCCIEEVKESSKRYDVDDTIRDYLTEKKLNVNIKHGSNNTELVYTNFFFMSNHPDALVFKQTDRRIQVLSGPDEVRPQQYYTKLYAWLDNMDNVAALNIYLRDRDISNFNWQKSTDTEGRRAMISSNETPTETAFWDFVNDTGKIVITKKQLCKRLQDYMEGDPFENPVEENQLVQILKKNFRQIGRIKYEGEAVRPWWLGRWSMKEIKSFDNKEIRTLIIKNES